MHKHNDPHSIKKIGREKMKNRWIYIAAAVAVVLLVIGGVVYYNVSGNYVATVSGEKISKIEYNFFLKDVKERMESTANLGSEEAVKTFWETSKIEGQDAVDAAKNKALDNAKEFKVQLIMAKNSKITLDKSDEDNINQAIDGMVKQAGSRTEADKQLKADIGMTLSEYKSFFKDYMLISKFIQAEQKKVQVTDEETKSFYTANLEGPSKVTVRHILLATVDQQQKPLSQEKQDEAKKKADEVLAKVKAGEDIRALASKYSEDPGSKDSGGEYTFEKGNMMKEFEDWSFSAKPGDTGIIKTSYGYHVMKKPTFDDLKDKANSGAVQEKYTKQLEDWKKDPKYNVAINKKVFDSIKVL